MSISNARARFLWLACSALSCACGADINSDSRRLQAPGSAGSGLPAAAAPTGTNPADPGIAETSTQSGNVCEAVSLAANPQVPDMMIVLDRSGSMTEGGRWLPSVSAVRRLTQGLQDEIRFGLTLFPDPKARDRQLMAIAAPKNVNAPAMRARGATLGSGIGGNSGIGQPSGGAGCAGSGGSAEYHADSLVITHQRYDSRDELPCRPNARRVSLVGPWPRCS